MSDGVVKTYPNCILDFVVVVTGPREGLTPPGYHSANQRGSPV